MSHHCSKKAHEGVAFTDVVTLLCCLVVSKVQGGHQQRNFLWSPSPVVLEVAFLEDDRDLTISMEPLFHLKGAEYLCLLLGEGILKGNGSIQDLTSCLFLPEELIFPLGVGGQKE